MQNATSVCIMSRDYLFSTNAGVVLVPFLAPEYRANPGFGDY